LPRLDCIELRRPSTKYSSSVFAKGTNDWNQFTLFELIAVHYHFLAASPSGETLPAYQPRDIAPLSPTLPFPDFTRLRLRRPGSAPPNVWQEATINLGNILQTTNCAADQRLEWGDVVEIPEADHPLDKQWAGFPKADFRALVKCLSRQVQLVIKGQTTNMTLAPSDAIVNVSVSTTPLHNAAFWIKPVVWDSGLVLASSDMSRVKVTRRDPATGQTREWVLDCSGGSPAPPLWLRDGDKIEVPEKTN
jgi:hypothetical protein